MLTSSDKVSTSWNTLNQLLTQIKSLLSRKKITRTRDRQSDSHKVTRQQGFSHLSVTNKHRLINHLQQLFEELIDQESVRSIQASRQPILYHDSMTECRQQDTNTSSFYFRQNNTGQICYLLQKKDMKNLVYCWKELDYMVQKLNKLAKDICQSSLLLKNKTTAEIKFGQSQPQEQNRYSGLQHMFQYQILKIKTLVSELQTSLNASLVFGGNQFQSVNNTIFSKQEVSINAVQMFYRQENYKCPREHILDEELLDSSSSGSSSDHQPADIYHNSQDLGKQCLKD